MCVCMFIEYCDFSTGSLYAQEERQNSLKGRLHFFKINTTPFEGMPHVFIDAGPEDCFLIATLRIFKINCVMWWYNFSILLVPSKSIVKKPQLPALPHSISLLQSFTTTGPLGAKHLCAYHTTGCPFDIFTLKSPWEVVTELCNVHRIHETACYIES